MNYNFPEYLFLFQKKLLFVSMFILILSCKGEESGLLFQKYKVRGSSILVPIKFKDKPITYFQLDTGSPRSYIKYCKAELSKVAESSKIKKQVHRINFVGKVFKRTFYLYNTSKNYDCNKIWAKGPIGTIGADFFENNSLVIDYIKKSFSMSPDYRKVEKEYKQSFYSINARVTSNRFIINLRSSNNEALPVMFDTGGGNSDIIVEYETWKRLTKKSKEDKSNNIFKAWSWNQYVNFITNTSSEDLFIGNIMLKKPTITFADSDAANFKFSKYKSEIAGIISNKLFEGKSVVILDFKNEYLRILRKSKRNFSLK